MFALLIGTTNSAATTIESLLPKLTRPAPAKTAFVEIRFSDLLVSALVLNGELSFNAIDQLGKRIDSPFRENTVIQGETVRVERDHQKPMQFSLKRAPELRALLVSFSALLLGDRASLENYFTVTVTGTERHWQIALHPKEKRMQKRIQNILTIGRENAPRCFVIAQVDGDVSVMAVDQAATETLPAQLSIESMMSWCRKGAD